MNNYQTHHKTRESAVQQAHALTAERDCPVYIIETHHWGRVSYWVTDTKPSRCVGEAVSQYQPQNK